MKVRDLFTRKGFRASLKPRPRGSDSPPSGGQAASARTPSRSAEPPTAPAAVSPAVLVERRDRLARDLAELQWDLGGLVYEMARRDDFRPDVVARRAARLRQLDAELADVERLIRLDQAGADGACPACGALFARGAVFCWQCGKTLSEQPAPAAANAGANNGPPRAAAPAPASSTQRPEARR